VLSLETWELLVTNSVTTQTKEQLPGRDLLALIFVIRMGFDVRAARATAMRTTCPPPSPVAPSINIGSMSVPVSRQSESNVNAEVEGVSLARKEMQRNESVGIG
jgi:hypothetical protein